MLYLSIENMIRVILGLIGWGSLYFQIYWLASLMLGFWLGCNITISAAYAERNKRAVSDDEYEFANQLIFGKWW